MTDNNELIERARDPESRKNDRIWALCEELIDALESAHAEIARLQQLDAEYGRVECAIIMADPAFDGDSDHASAADRLIASVERLAVDRDAIWAEATAAAHGVMLKPLEWTIIGDGKGRDIYSTVYVTHTAYGAYYIGLQPKGKRRFDWSGPNNKGSRDIATAEEAKLLAQADYERRIFSAICSFEGGQTNE